MAKPTGPFLLCAANPDPSAAGEIEPALFGDATKGVERIAARVLRTKVASIFFGARIQRLLNTPMDVSH